jgi:hypothetical protein
VKLNLDQVPRSRMCEVLSFRADCAAPWYGAKQRLSVYDTAILSLHRLTATQTMRSNGVIK